MAGFEEFWARRQAEKAALEVGTRGGTPADFQQRKGIVPAPVVPNRPFQESGLLPATLGAVANTIPFVMKGAPTGLPAVAAAGAIGGGTEAGNQILQALAGTPSAPQTSTEAATRIANSAATYGTGQALGEGLYKAGPLATKLAATGIGAYEGQEHLGGWTGAAIGGFAGWKLANLGHNELMSMYAPGQVGRAVRLLTAKAARSQSAQLRAEAKMLSEGEVASIRIRDMLDNVTTQTPLSVVDKTLLETGQFDKFAESRVNSLANTVGRNVSDSDFAQLSVAASRNSYSVAQQPQREAYEYINQKVGGEVEQTMSFGSSTQRGVRASLGVRVKPGTGLDVPSERIAAKAAELAALGEGAGAVKPFIEEISKLPADVPYAKLNAIQKDLSEDIQDADVLKLAPRVKRALVSLRSTINGEMERTLRMTGHGDLADLRKQADRAYGQVERDYNNLFLRKLQTYVNPQRKGAPEDVVRILLKAEPSEITTAFKTFGPEITEGYRETMSRDLLFSKAIVRDEATGIETLSGKALLESMDKVGRPRLEAIYGGRQIPSELEAIGKVLQTVQSKEGAAGIASKAAQLGTDGLVLTRAIRDPATGVSLAKMTIPPDIVMELLKNGQGKAIQQALLTEKSKLGTFASGAIGRLIAEAGSLMVQKIKRTGALSVGSMIGAGELPTSAEDFERLTKPIVNFVRPPITPTP